MRFSAVGEHRARRLCRDAVWFLDHPGRGSQTPDSTIKAPVRRWLSKKTQTLWNAINHGEGAPAGVLTVGAGGGPWPVLSRPPAFPQSSGGRRLRHCHRRARLRGGRVCLCSRGKYEGAHFVTVCSVGFGLGRGGERGVGEQGMLFSCLPLPQSCKLRSPHGAPRPRLSHLFLAWPRAGM